MPTRDFTVKDLATHFQLRVAVMDFIALVAHQSPRSS
jgi:hypothetical protein